MINTTPPRPAMKAAGKAVVLDWCHGFYNHQRRHSTIGMVSPITYENTVAPVREAA